MRIRNCSSGFRMFCLSCWAYFYSAVSRDNRSVTNIVATVLWAVSNGEKAPATSYNMINEVEFSRKSLAQIQASSGSGLSASEGAVRVLTAPRRNAGIHQPSASQK